MSRGGTRKARDEQQARRRSRQRKEEVETKARRKADKKLKPKPRVGKGRAALVHVSGIVGPMILSSGLVLSGTLATAQPGTGYWLSSVVGDPNAPYIAEPAGLVYVVFVLIFAASALALAPVRLWRRLTRHQSIVMKDRTAIDSTLTLSAVVVAVWVYRVFAGYSDPISSIAVALMILSVYVPVFSALLALIMPVIPGSGRVGGILPNFLRIPFTRRYLLSEEERQILGEFAEAAQRGEEAEA